MESIYIKLAEILDVEAVHPEDVLREFADWDSLTVLAILAMADSKYGVTIRAEDMAGMVKASDLADFLAAHKK